MKTILPLPKLKKKSIYIPVFMILTSLAFMGCKGQQDNPDDESRENVEQSNDVALNQLSSKEKEDNWKLLFDGESTTGWRGYGKDTFPKGWVIEDGALKVQGSGAGEAGDGGDIIFDQQFKDFELSLEYKVSEGGNSGIFYLAKEVEGEPIYTSSPEFQILDNERHPDGKLGKNGNRKSASLYDLIPAEPQNAKPVGEWNSISIIVYRGTVIHSQNGENVVEYHLWTDEWKDMVANSKFKNWDNFVNAGGEDKKGYIGLQDHGDDVWFRNIKIKEL